MFWKDVDEKWLNELINKKEENLLQNIYRSNSVSSNNNHGSAGVSNNDDSDLNDNTYNPYFN